MGVTRLIPPTTANRVSNTLMKTIPTGRPTPRSTQPSTKTPAVDYPPPMGVPWKCIVAMMRDDKSCPGCNSNKLNDPPRLKFHQEVVFPALFNHGYIFRKDVMASFYNPLLRTSYASNKLQKIDFFLTIIKRPINNIYSIAN